MVRQRTFDEKIIYATLSLTWVWYVIGALYIIAPVLAWLMFGRVIYGWITEPRRTALSAQPVPPLIWIWIAGMLGMLIALVMGHMNFGLSSGQTLKSAIGWAKGWALLAMFPLLGACLQVRPDIIYRASAVVAFQTILLVPLMLLAPMIGVPSPLYISPLQAVGGPGPEFFEVQLYGINPEGGIRWRFFTPWAPAAAIAYGMLFVLALRERTPWLQIAGWIAIIAVAFMCKSRLGFVAIPLSLLAAYALSRLTNPRLLLMGAAVVGLTCLAGPQLIDFVMEQKDRMDQMRADSSFVRAALGRIAYDRWIGEAPIWGHGIVELGPHLVEYMPIGSHHSWYGLLFVKGIVGFFSLLVPLVVTIVELIVRAQTSRTARTALAIMLMFTFFTFTENVEILAYLMWPGLMMVGIASRERYASPFRPLLGAGHSRALPAQA